MMKNQHDTALAMSQQQREMVNASIVGLGFMMETSQ
jgi:hypothetical protein